MGDQVNHPSHYNTTKYEVIDVIDAYGLDFSLGNTIKYILRHKSKGKPEEDLRKALWYLQHYLDTHYPEKKSDSITLTPKTELPKSDAIGVWDSQTSQIPKDLSAPSIFDKSDNVGMDRTFG